jgi:DNA segregation ATPase FtsK/SpoIIIE-like protein
VYTLPDPGVLRRTKAAARGEAESSARVAEALVQALANFAVDASLVGEIAGPRVTRYELQLAPGT